MLGIEVEGGCGDCNFGVGVLGNGVNECCWDVFLGGEVVRVVGLLGFRVL